MSLRLNLTISLVSFSFLLLLANFAFAATPTPIPYKADAINTEQLTILVGTSYSRELYSHYQAGNVQRELPSFVKPKELFLSAIMKHRSSYNARPSPFGDSSYKLIYVFDNLPSYAFGKYTVFEPSTPETKLIISHDNLVVVLLNGKLYWAYAVTGTDGKASLYAYIQYAEAGSVLRGLLTQNTSDVLNNDFKDDFFEARFILEINEAKDFFPSLPIATLISKEGERIVSYTLSKARLPAFVMTPSQTFGNSKETDNYGHKFVRLKNLKASDFELQPQNSNHWTDGQEIEWLLQFNLDYSRIYKQDIYAALMDPATLCPGISPNAWGGPSAGCFASLLDAYPRDDIFEGLWDVTFTSETNYLVKDAVALQGSYVVPGLVLGVSQPVYLASEANAGNELYRIPKAGYYLSTVPKEFVYFKVVEIKDKSVLILQVDGKGKPLDSKATPVLLLAGGFELVGNYSVYLAKIEGKKATLFFSAYSLVPRRTSLDPQGIEKLESGIQGAVEGLFNIK